MTEIARFSGWNAPGGVAGGGIKPGITYGRSDDDGYEAVENPMQIAYLHTTILADRRRECKC